MPPGQYLIGRLSIRHYLQIVAMDTMDLWIDLTRDTLLEVLKKVDCILINDSEVRLLTGEANLIKGAKMVTELGPKTIIMKKGEHGAVLIQDDNIFTIPALPLETVIDPTGAGDSFAGGFMGYIANQNSINFDTLRQAVVHGTMVASYTCEAFGPDQLAKIDEGAIKERLASFRSYTAF